MQAKKISAFFSMILAHVYFHYHLLLPQSVREVINPAMEKIYLLAQSVLAAVRKLRSCSFVVVAVCGGSELKIMFIGNDPRRSYILQSTGLDIVEIRKGERYFLWNLSGPAEDAGGIDLVIVESAIPFTAGLRGKGYFLVPHWVNFRMAVPGTLSDLWKGANKGAKNDIREAEKNGYTFEVSTAPDSLLMFYEKMYVPYVMNRFSDLAVVQDYAVLRKMLKMGGILFVKQHEEIVGGHLLLFNDNVLWAKWLGVKNGDEKKVRGRAFSSITYSVIKYAIENKFTVIDFGLCRAFLNDGVFRYKRKWGMVLGRSWLSFDYYGLKVCRLSTGVINFLRRNPFVFSSEDGYEGLVCLQSEFPDSGEMREAYRYYRTKGLKRLNIMFPSQASQEFQVDPFPAEITPLRCVGADFLLDQGELSHGK